jgi:hypothetical protein
VALFALTPVALSSWALAARDAASVQKGHAPEALTAALGLTSAQVHKIFGPIDGKNTVFRATPAVHDVPRVLNSGRPPVHNRRGERLLRGR